MKEFWRYLAEAIAIRPRKQKPIDPPVHIEPDPDMQPGWWTWECAEPGCETGGTGPDQIMRQSSMMHCLNTGHSVMGNYVGGE